MIENNEIYRCTIIKNSFFNHVIVNIQLNRDNLTRCCIKDNLQSPIFSALGTVFASELSLVMKYTSTPQDREWIVRLLSSATLRPIIMHKFSQTKGTNRCLLMGAKFKTRMYGCANIGWLSVFHSKRSRKLEKNNLLIFFALKVFYVQTKAKLLKISAGLP